MKMPLAGLLITLAVVAAAAIAFTVSCLVNIARAAEVRSLSRGAWVAICLVSMPWGGIIYLMAGKVWPDREIPLRARRWPMWHGR